MSPLPSRLHFHSLALAFAAALAAGATAQITPGNLVVVRIGDGSAPLTSAATAVFLDEYTSGGTFVQKLGMPTLVSGANRRFTNSGVATSEGFLNLSADGKYLVAGGYDAQVGTASIAATASASTNRVVARVDLAGNVDTSTALSDAYTGNNIRSATSDNGTQFWTGGTGSGAAGSVRYATLGATTSTQLATNVTNTRVVGIANGQLYVTSAATPTLGVCTVGTGLPTTSSQTIALLPGFPTTSGPSSYDFFFASATTVYVADDGAAGGIQKWTLSGGTWSLQYTLSPGTGIACRGLTGLAAGGLVTLWATTTLASANQIVTVTDVGAGSRFTAIATAATDTVLRGVRYVPGRGSIVRITEGCGPTTITVTGQPSPGGSVTTTLGAITGQAFLGLGVNLAAIPFCGCTIGHEWLVALSGAALTLPIPNTPSLVGGRVGIQGVDAFSTGGCVAPPFTATDTIVVTIG